MTAQPLHWRLSRLDPSGCAGGIARDREQPDLRDHFVTTGLQTRVIAATADLRGAPEPLLLQMIADARVDLPSRIAAGNVLALAVDPRIAAFSPPMVRIPGDEVSIGLDPERIDAAERHLAQLGIVDSWIARQVPRHQVRLRPHALARFPVTNCEYRRFLMSTGFCELPGSWAFGRYPAERANHPVHGVSAAAAQAYARWLSWCTGRAFRLPTEAEWEHAAAGPQGLTYPWGDRFDPALCNTAECGLLDTSPVGVFVGGESPFGLSDMAGNVEEYVADDPAPWPGEEVDDPAPCRHGRYRVARGGGFSGSSDLARTQLRHGYNPRSTAYAIGFRLAESVNGTTPMSGTG
jgi:formylglycine-generating enzyme required for sulfatase activity